MARQELILDRYRVKKKAGSGGYASVYHAYDTKLKRDVAIKVIELSESDVARARLLAMEVQLRGEMDVAADAGADIAIDNAAAAAGADIDEDDLFDHIPGLQEARMVAHLSDANIVTVYDCVLQDATAYVIMEYVEGKTLAQIMEESGDQMTLDVVAAVFQSVAHALEVAHASDVLHLDIKPDNVMVDSRGVVKVTDFGLATLLDASGHGTAGGGTIGYMPLEQMRQEALDARTDQWALASLLYEMLAGENPFFADSLVLAEAAIEEAELVLPSLCWDDMDTGMDDVVFKALDLEPASRYATVSRFAEAMAPYLGDAAEGKKQLARLVSGEAPDVLASADAPAQPAVPLIELVSDRMAMVAVRLASLAGALAIAAFSLVNIHVVEGSAWGVATDALPVFGGFLLAVAVATIVRPHAGALAALVMLSAACLANGAYVPGVLVLLGGAAWWWLIGRSDDVQPCLVLLQPLFGAVGFGAISPMLAGCFLTVGRAVITAAFSVLLAAVFASLGSHDLMGWNAVVNMRFAGMDVQAVFFQVVVSPQTWCVAASWVLAAAVTSLFCVRQSRAFDVAGACLGAVILVAGACLGAAVVSTDTSLLPTVAAFVGALLPGVVGISMAALGVADRARWEEEE